MSVTSHMHNDGMIIDSPTDPHFVIDIITRSISNPSNKKITLMQYDEKSERYTFDVERMVEGHDLLDCNRIQIHYINLGSDKTKKHPGVYLVNDAQVNPSDNNKLSFTWLISNDSTMFSGILSFLVSFECVNGDTIMYRWSSSIYNSIQITTGMDNNNTVYETYADELLEWENSMETEFLPNLVDKCYIERDFATSDEVATVFDINDPDGPDPVTIVPYDVVTDTEIDNLFNEVTDYPTPVL